MSGRPACHAARSWAALVAVLAAACSDPSAGPMRHAGAALFSKTSSPTVSSASPASAYQGTMNLDVHVNGSGFDPGSKASWNLNGVPYGKIVVNSTSYVSSSQLVANISVASDAQIANYDIAVTTSSQKQGIGSDMFAVTLATAIPVTGWSINQAGQIVGEVGSNGSTGALWDPQAGLVTIPNATTLWAIDESGSTIGGRDGNGHAAVWTSTSGAVGPWVETLLPVLSGGSAARSLVSDASGHAIMLAGNASSGTQFNPAVWTLTSAGWQLTINRMPATPAVHAFAQGINVKGQTVGMDGSTCCYAFYWDSLGNPTVLAPTASGSQAAAWSINGDGTVAVGNSNGLAVMWTRTLSNGVYSAWSGAIALESTGTYCSKGTSAAFAVNAAGTIAVGRSCDQATAWFLSGGTATRFMLGGLGPPNTSTAYAINNLASPNAAGPVNNGGAYWKNF